MEYHSPWSEAAHKSLQADGTGVPAPRPPTREEYEALFQCCVRLTDRIGALEASLVVVRWLVFLLALLTLLLALSSATAHAKEGGDWSNVDPEVREWIKSLKMPDVPQMSCCGEADAYEADLGEQDADGRNYAIITGTRGNPLPVGTKLLVPPTKVQNKMGNPTDHVIVFASTSGIIYCYVPNGSN